jgi:cytoskeletal protein RodZ
MASASPFGEHLRREREMRGVSLAEISSATRISTKFLEAIENGQWDRLPGGAFNRGYIRSTSRYLGLDEDSMVAEYALETNGNGTHRSVSHVSRAQPGRSYRPSVRSAVVIAALVVLIGLAWLVVSKIVRRARAYKHPTTTSVELPARIVRPSLRANLALGIRGFPA